MTESVPLKSNSDSVQKQEDMDKKQPSTDEVASHVDCLPIVSQLKCAWLVMNSQAEAAKQTQENFTRNCPLWAPFRYAREKWREGDEVNAKETRRQCTEYVKRSVNDAFTYVPGLGYIKSGYHYYYGQTEEYNAALKEANRTANMAAGGIGGLLVGGPVGALAAGTAAGVAFDQYRTVQETQQNGQYTPVGLISTIGKIKSGELFNSVQPQAITLDEDMEMDGSSERQQC